VFACIAHTMPSEKPAASTQSRHGREPPLRRSRRRDSFGHFAAS
jgi:hypothetical protein